MSSNLKELKNQCLVLQAEKTELQEKISTLQKREKKLSHSLGFKDKFMGGILGKSEAKQQLDETKPELKTAEDRFNQVAAQYDTTNKELYGIIEQRLIAEDLDVRKWIDKIFQLFYSSTIIGSVSGMSQGIYTSHAKALEGKMSKNGRIYADTTSRGLALANIQKALYPTEFSGFINWKGEVYLKATKTAMDILNRTPKRYIGEIHPGGEIVLREDKKSMEMTGSSIISRVIINPFPKSKTKHQQYLQLRKAVSDRVKAAIRAI